MCLPNVSRNSGSKSSPGRNDANLNNAFKWTLNLVSNIDLVLTDQKNLWLTQKTFHLLGIFHFHCLHCPALHKSYLKANFNTACALSVHWSVMSHVQLDKEMNESPYNLKRLSVPMARPHRKAVLESSNFQFPSPSIVSVRWTCFPCKTSSNFPIFQQYALQTREFFSSLFRSKRFHKVCS